MTQKKILQLVGLKSNEYTRPHANRISRIFEVIRELVPCVTLAETTPQTCYFGRSTEVNRWGNEVTNNEGQELPGTRYDVKTDSGAYSFVLPDVLRGYMDEILGFALPNQKPTETALFPEDQNVLILEVTKELETEVKNAAKFVSKDLFRFQYTYIRFEVEAGALRLVATDAHTLYMGQILPSFGLPDGVYCLPVFQPKAGDKITFNLTKREATHGANVMKIEEYQLNWKSVIPNWVEGEMVFDRKAVYTLVDNVKKAASDIKNKVKFHLNGSIQATAGDDNLKTSATASTPYESKTFEDLDMSFNGKLFNRGLSVLRGKKATFKHSGAKRPALLTDSVREVIIMPLMID